MIKKLSFELNILTYGLKYKIASISVEVYSNLNNLLNPMNEL